MDLSAENTYPSTFDVTLAPIAGAEDDVLVCLENALERYQAGPTWSRYITPSYAEVCAIGAVMAVTMDNAQIDEWLRWENEGVPREYQDEYRVMSTDTRMLSLWFEKRMGEVANEAIRELNAAALRLFPEVGEGKVDSEGKWTGSWSGPLEWINQTHDEWSDAVVQCYQEAIRHRQEMVPA